MKLLSFLFFSAALIWSWNVIHSTAGVSTETHAAIQGQVGNLISDAILRAEPSAREVQIDNIWTESLSHDQIRAHVKYSYISGEGLDSARTEIQGTGLLKRQTETEGTDNWTLIEFKSNKDHLIFEEPQVVTPGPDEN